MTENPWNLTPKEIAVIEAITRLGARKLVVKELSLSTVAVDKSLQAAYTKMGAKNTLVAAVAWDRHVRIGQ